MPGYFLPPAVHVCFTSDGSVFLDIKNDRYYGLDEQASRTLQALLVGRSDGDDNVALVNDLLGRGLLTAAAREGRVFRPVTVLCAQASFLDLVTDERPVTKLTDIARFFAACLHVAAVLRIRSLEHVLGLLRRTTVESPDSVDEAELRRKVQVFRYLRPLVYASRDQCLYDSLVLSYFLRMNRIPSTLVIGVKTLPFAAHCWVQMDRLVLNGTHDFVRGFAAPRLGPPRCHFHHGGGMTAPLTR